MKLSKISIAFLVVSVLLVILNVYQFMQTDQLQGDISYYQKEIDYRDDWIDELRQPNLEGINIGFVEENFAGIVYNTGKMTAYNAKLVL